MQCSNRSGLKGITINLITDERILTGTKLVELGLVKEVAKSKTDPTKY